MATCRFQSPYVSVYNEDVGAVITLTTDFGLVDGYVSAVKGVILGINPEANLVDVSHQIRPQDVREAAFVLYTVHAFFPAQTVHLVIIDPGVGTDRRAIIVKTPRALFVAPDNGVLSYVLAGHSSPAGVEPVVKLDSEFKAYVINKADYWRQPVSDTFHGRDIFAPVAARLSLGMPPGSLGESVDTLVAFPLPRPVGRKGIIQGQVLHVDGFGNLITDIRKEDLPSSVASVTIEIAGQQIDGVARTYAGHKGLTALVGSSGYLEVASPDGSAAELLGVRLGEKVTVRSGG